MNSREAFDRDASKFIIALDFDGTLVDRGAFPGIGEDLGSKSYLLELQNRGAEFILFTLRDGQMLLDAISYMQIELDLDNFYLNSYPPATDWTISVKPFYTVLVDDRSLGVPLRTGRSGKPAVDWEKAGPMLLSLMDEWDQNDG